MAKQSNSMFRITQLAKDLGLKPKELVGRLEEVGVSVKSNSATLEADLEQKQCNFSDYNVFEENLQALVEELNVVLNDIVTEQSGPSEKVKDPEANRKLREALGGLKDAVDTCSSTQCKRILDGIEGIAFESSQEALLRKLKELIEDYDFGEAAEIIESLEKTLA